MESSKPKNVVEEKNKCNFCFNTFFNNSSLKRHQLICKEQNNPIRLLEIENDIKPKEPQTKTECRFCNKVLFNTSKLNGHLLICKKREEYHQGLLNKNVINLDYDISNYIYLLKEREFINLGVPVYKIGKSKQDNLKRFKQYPKGSLLIYQIICKDCDKIEQELIKIFKVEFNQRTDIGTEYFEGNCENMIELINDMRKKLSSY
jgi:hypothetical protein